MKKVNIFLMSILAICCAFVMMSPKSYQSSYAIGNDSINTFVSLPMYINTKLSSTYNSSTHNVSISSNDSTSTFYFNYVLTQTADGMVFSLKDGTLYYFPSTGDAYTYTNYVFEGSNITAGGSSSFVITSDTAYQCIYGGIVFWFDYSGTISGSCTQLSISYAHCVDPNTSNLDSRIPSNLLDPNYTLGTRSMMIHTLTFATGGLKIYFLVPNYLPTDDTVIFDSNMSESQYYQNGYNAGYSSGRQDGFNAGNSSGYDDGYNVGYNAGHSAGVLDANDYSFIGLMGSVIDAPVAAIRGLLSFNILGVDISAFVFGLFTITIILVIIKKVKGL